MDSVPVYEEKVIYVYKVVKRVMGCGATAALRFQVLGDPAMTDCPHIKSLAGSLARKISEITSEVGKLIAVRLVFVPPQGIVAYRDLKYARCLTLSEELIDELFEELNKTPL